jgi:sulfur carrier protein
VTGSSGDVVIVNGEHRSLPVGATVDDVVRTLTDRPQGCAVAVNDLVVPRSRWASQAIAPGDRVEVLTAAQGG